MKNILKKMLVVSVLLAACGQASAGESFIGGSVGAVTYPDSVTSDTTFAVNSVHAANTGTTILGSGTQNTGSTGLKIFGGSWLSDSLGYEVGYADLGKSKETITTTGVATTWNAEASGSAFYGAALGGLKLNETSRIVGKLGVYSANFKVAASVTGPGGSASLNSSSSNTDLLVGVGYEYKLTHALNLRTEYELFNNVKVGSANASFGLLTLGLSYNLQ